MTATTETVRDQAFRPLAGDIPEGMTLAQYRASRPRASRRRRAPGRRAQFSTK
jgi:hypothetical protein